MATYKAVMRPALEYASSIWSPLASSTSINKLQVMQNAALRTATECIQDTNIHLHDETLIRPIHDHLQLIISFNFTHICTTLWTNHAVVTALLVRWTEKLFGGPLAGTSDPPPPPLARVMGVGRQHVVIASMTD